MHIHMSAWEYRLALLVICNLTIFCGMNNEILLVRSLALSHYERCKLTSQLSPQFLGKSCSQTLDAIKNAAELSQKSLPDYFLAFVGRFVHAEEFLMGGYNELSI